MGRRLENNYIEEEKSIKLAECTRKTAMTEKRENAHKDESAKKNTKKRLILRDVKETS